MTRMLLMVTAIAATLPWSAGAKDAAGQDPMSAWKPPKVEREQRDRKEIGRMFAAMHEAGVKGDIDAAAALVDFPVLMVTDDSKGDAMSGTWDREKWLQAMRPFYRPGSHPQVQHKPTITLLSDSLASIVDQATITMGQRKVTVRSSTLAVRKDGQWRVKAMTEGGWGDMMKDMPATAGASTPAGGTTAGSTSGGASTGTGTGTSSTGR